MVGLVMKYTLNRAYNTNYGLYKILQNNILYIQHSDIPKSKDEKCFYYQAVIRYNFKSNITFYNILNNINNKMSF